MSRDHSDLQPSVLIFRFGQLGDTLVALPAISAIRRRHPEHRLVLLTPHHPASSGRISSWSLLHETGWFDEVLFYEQHLRLFPKALWAMSLAMQLRKKRFDHVYNLAPDRRTTRQLLRDRLFCEIMIDAKHYHAEGRAIDHSHAHGISQTRVEQEWLRLLRIVQPHPDIDELNRFRLSIPQNEHKNAQSLLRDLGVAPTQALVAFGPGSKMPAKEWPEDRFENVGTALLAQFKNIVLVTVGGAEERALCERLCAAWGPRSRNLAGHLSVYGSAAVLSRCAVYVGNDAGPMHLAAMAGTRCVAIFSARDVPGRWEPFGSGHIILREKPECAGCMLEVCEQERKKCLTRIPVDSVLTAAVQCIRSHVHEAEVPDLDGFR